MRNIKRTAVVGGTVAALIGGGVAFAYWTTSGTGTGSAVAGSDVGVTVAQVGSIAGLTPDGTPQDINFKINNPASTNQYITSVTVSMTGVSGPHISAATPCTTADFAVTQPTVTPGDLTTGDHSYLGNGATIQLVNHNSNQDGCKDAIVALAFSAQ